MLLGREFGDRLLGCLRDAALSVAPDVAPSRGVDAIADQPRNLLGRLDACMDVGSVSEILHCFRVSVPNETHLLAAVHAARGTLHATLNFDDGVERAYALLAGTAALGGNVPPDYHEALRRWRKVVCPSEPLHVVASDLRATDYRRRPLLVKLRGSLRGGFADSLVPGQPSLLEVDAQTLSSDQMAAVAAVMAEGRLVVVGVSGADADVRASLFPLLTSGRFSWTAAAMSSDLVSHLNDIDRSQPTLAPSLQGMRVSVSDASELPSWPRSKVPHGGFDECFKAWQAKVPVAAAAEAYAWLLSDAGMRAEAIPILQALLARHACTRTRVLLEHAHTAPDR